MQMEGSLKAKERRAQVFKKSNYETGENTVELLKYFQASKDMWHVYRRAI